MNIDCIVWVIISYCFIYFVAQIVPVLATGSTLVTLFLFVIPSSLQAVLKHSLPPGTPGCIMLILYIFLPGFTISHFSMESWLLLLENGTGNQDRGAWYRH